MIGYHIFYQYSKETNFLDICSQFASALFWKKNFGPIKLYCNTEHLKMISKYQIDSIYDEINVFELDNIPYEPDILIKYWSLVKIYAASKIQEDKFCIIDTDLWITQPFKWNEDVDFMGFHYESFNLDNIHNPYLPPSLFLNDIRDEDWDELPINCSFIFINNKILLDKWLEFSNKVINLNKNIETNIYGAYTLFIEQRAITKICKDLNLKCIPLIDNVYKSGLDLESNVWSPPLDLSQAPQKYIRHIWGLKRLLHLHSKFIEVIFNDIHETFGFLEIQYPELYVERLKVLQDEKYNKERIKISVD
jgi:hypothetical protein